MAHAAMYDANVGHMSRIVADRLVQLTDSMLPDADPDSSAFNIGAGTGTLTIQLSRRFPSVPILTMDISAGMLAVIDPPPVERDNTNRGRVPGRARSRPAAPVTHSARSSSSSCRTRRTRSRRCAARFGLVVGFSADDLRREERADSGAGEGVPRALIRGTGSRSRMMIRPATVRGVLEKALGDAGAGGGQVGDCIGEARA